jgi:hypothetical protein
VTDGGSLVQPRAPGVASRADAAWTALEAVPPLAFMTALAALASMALNQGAIPALGTGTSSALLKPLTQAGDFSENLAVVAGLIALCACALSTWRGGVLLNARRRLLLVIFLTVLLREVIVATFLDRTHTTREHVYFAVGAANLLCVAIGMRALDLAGSWLTRSVAGFATALPLLNVLCVLLELTTDVQLDPWKHRAYETMQALGELCYLGLLLGSFPLLAARGVGPRQLVARAAGLLTLLGAGYGLRVAHAELHKDFAIVLYNAQRVGLLLDRAPAVYAVPMCLALAAAVNAMIAGGGARLQAAAATLLLLASGYGPRAPGRLLTMTLGFVLLARAIAALGRRRETA